MEKYTGEEKRRKEREREKPEDNICLTFRNRKDIRDHFFMLEYMSNPARPKALLQ